MNILVTAATMLEIQPFLQYLGNHAATTTDHQYSYKNLTVTIRITGIGMMSTAWHLGRELAALRPSLAIQAGIAGTFDHTLPLGSVVAVGTEYFGDLGAEDHDQFIDLFDIGLWQPGQPPFTGNALINTFDRWPAQPSWPVVTGVTVNLISGSQPTISRLEKKYAPVVESMEGAAFHYACLLDDIPFLQLRSISNYVEIRDKSKWKIGPAVQQLNQELIQLLDQLSLS